MKCAIVKSSNSWGGGEKIAYELALGLKENCLYLGKINTPLYDKLNNAGIETFNINLGPELDKKIGIFRFIINKPLIDSRVKSIIKLLAGHKVKSLTLESINEQLLLTLPALEQKIKVFWIFHQNIEGVLINPYYQKLKKMSHLVEAITPSNYLADILKKHFSFTNVTIIPNGIDKTAPNRTTEKLKDDYHLKNKKIIGFVGRLHKEKGVDLLIKTMAEIRNTNIKLLIIGDGPDKKYFVNLTNKLGITDKVIFTGEKSDSENYYQLFDLFVLPSRRDNQPLTILEAASQNIPIVSTCSGGIKEIANNIGVVCCAENDLAQTIINSLEKPQQTKLPLENKRMKMIEKYQKILL